jgi:hypothetical protein
MKLSSGQWFLSQYIFQLAANKADLMVLEEEIEVLTKPKGTRIQWEKQQQLQPAKVVKGGHCIDQDPIA